MIAYRKTENYLPFCNTISISAKRVAIWVSKCMQNELSSDNNMPLYRSWLQHILNGILTCKIPSQKEFNTKEKQQHCERGGIIYREV